MADAGIVASRGKYRHKVARPVRWINWPNLDLDGEPIPGRPLWEPLGAQASRGAAAQAGAGSQAALQSAPASVFGSRRSGPCSIRARPLVKSISQSRIWLGVHWRFDATYGSQVGEEIARIVTDRCYRPREQHLSGAWG
jgi:hypothetical protein